MFHPLRPLFCRLLRCDYACKSVGEPRLQCWKLGQILQQNGLRKDFTCYGFFVGDFKRKINFVLLQSVERGWKYFEAEMSETLIFNGNPATIYCAIELQFLVKCIERETRNYVGIIFLGGSRVEEPPKVNKRMKKFWVLWDIRQGWPAAITLQCCKTSTRMNLMEIYEHFY